MSNPTVVIRSGQRIHRIGGQSLSQRTAIRAVQQPQQQDQEAELVEALHLQSNGTHKYVSTVAEIPRLIGTAGGEFQVDTEQALADLPELAPADEIAKELDHAHTVATIKVTVSFEYAHGDVNTSKERVVFEESYTKDQLRKYMGKADPIPASTVFDKLGKAFTSRLSVAMKYLPLSFASLLGYRKAPSTSLGQDVLVLQDYACVLRTKQLEKAAAKMSTPQI